MRHIHKFIILSLVAVFFVPVLTLLTENFFKVAPNIAYADVPGGGGDGGGCGCDSGSSGSSGSCCK